MFSHIGCPSSARACACALRQTQSVSGVALPRRDAWAAPQPLRGAVGGSPSHARVEIVVIAIVAVGLRRLWRRGAQAARAPLPRIRESAGDAKAGIDPHYFADATVVLAPVQDLAAVSGLDSLNKVVFVVEFDQRQGAVATLARPLDDIAARARFLDAAAEFNRLCGMAMPCGAMRRGPARIPPMRTLRLGAVAVRSDRSGGGAAHLLAPVRTDDALDGLRRMQQARDDLRQRRLQRSVGPVWHVLDDPLHLPGDFRFGRRRRQAREMSRPCGDRVGGLPSGSGRKFSQRDFFSAWMCLAQVDGCPISSDIIRSTMIASNGHRRGPVSGGSAQCSGSAMGRVQSSRSSSAMSASARPASGDGR